MDYADLNNKVAVVTGAAGNLGPFWIKGLLDQGAIVIALCFPGTEMDPIFNSIRKNDKLMLIPADITSKNDLKRALEFINKQYGPPHILVANAGIDHPPTSNKTFKLGNLKRLSFSSLMEVNIWGTFQSIQVFGGAMVKEKRGAIVIIGSMYGVISSDERFYNHIPVNPPFIKHPGYGATKAALINLVKYFCTHWAKKGVRINALSPGGVLGKQDPEFIKKFSERVPLGRLAHPSELVAPMLFLASEGSSYITGINLLVDGGYTAW
jgi:NAD(P)-dependent dehydrogenase (short-subunit alcohol dehydrogenase family)